jgi:hypothetical protein
MPEGGREGCEIPPPASSHWGLVCSQEAKYPWGGGRQKRPQEPEGVVERVVGGGSGDG